MIIIIMNNNVIMCSNDINVLVLNNVWRNDNEW